MDQNPPGDQVSYDFIQQYLSEPVAGKVQVGEN
jgi:hypothetical protein